MTVERTVVVLTDDQMATIERCIEGVESLGDWPVPITVAWEQIMGKEAWAAAESITPWEWGIPSSQWKQICGWLVDMGKRLSLETDAGVHLGLEWMNRGPSAVE